MRSTTLAEALNAQGGSYTLIERHPDGPRLQQVSVIRRAHALPGHAEAVAGRMAAPRIRIVTMTVTEKGYGADLARRRLDPENAAIAQDLARAGAPLSLPGLLCHGLALRRAAGLDGLTLMSCDNLPDNGHLLRALVLEMAERADPALAGWIARNCTFPCTMVDRITPASTDATRELAHAALGRPDLLAIETEPFRQWVIEDAFAGPRPAWQQAGVQIVTDVARFEAMKLRVLNGAHSLIAFLGCLAGLPAVRDVMARADMAALVRGHMEQAAATLEPPEGQDPAAYGEALIERFANPAIDHRCAQIVTDSSQKLPQRVFAPARDRLDSGQAAGTFALAIAAWIRLLEEQQETANDPMAGRLAACLGTAGPVAGDRVAALARLDGLVHHGTLDHPGFAASVADRLVLIRTTGIVETVRRQLAG